MADHFFFCSCRSFVGMISQVFQPQGITLGANCVFFRIVVHEIGHALGLYHEHQRPDRDTYIDIIEQNIRPGFEHNFVKQEDANTLGLGYDFASIMHYRATAFGIDGAVTIITRHPGIFFGNAQELSPLDAAKTNALYQCGK